MKIFNYYIDALKNYANFKGRANRSQFWYFILFNFIISFILAIIHKNLGAIYSLAVLIPSLALGSRRLHDIGKSGWWLLFPMLSFPFLPVILMVSAWIAQWSLALLAFVPIILITTLFALKGDEEDNDYGAVVESDVIEDNQTEENAENFQDGVREEDKENRTDK